MKLNFHTKTLAVAVLFICIYGLFLRAQVFQGRGYNVDEECHFNYALSAPFEPFWQRLYYGAELTSYPGFYLTTVPFVKMFTTHKWGVAVPHIIATILGFWSLFLICRKWFKTVWATLITFFIVAVHRELIYHAFELRPYAVLPAFGLITFYLIERIMSAKDVLPLRERIWLAALFIFMINYHAYGMLMFTVCTVYFFLREASQSSYGAVLKKVFPFYGPLGLLVVPLWLWYYSGTPELHREIFQFIANPLLDPVKFFRDVVGNLLGNKSAYILFLGPLLLCWRVIGREQVMYLLLLIVLPILLIFLSDVRAEYWFIQRQFIWVMPYFAIFIGWCWDRLIMSFQGPGKAGRDRFPSTT